MKFKELSFVEINLISGGTDGRKIASHCKLATYIVVMSSVTCYLIGICLFAAIGIIASYKKR